MKMHWMTIAPLLALAACAGKPDAAATSAADSAAVAPAAVTDSVVKADSGAKAATDSAAKPTTGAKAVTKETGDYDQAIKPRFKIDEKTGKIDTIRKP